jgi:hypothetical protein
VCRELETDAGRARTTAQRTWRRLQAAGLDCAIVDHDRLGLVVLVETPWHEHRVPVRTNDDVEYLLAELANGAAIAEERAA